jgi:hypothetical protein
MILTLFILKLLNISQCHSRAACGVGANAPYSHGAILAGEGGNPAVLNNMPLMLTLLRKEFFN